MNNIEKKVEELRGEFTDIELGKLIKAIRKTLPKKKDVYRKYLNSEDWEKKRNKYLEDKCVLCGSAHKLQLHHLTYKRIYEESETDFATLCFNCHQCVHWHCGKKVSVGTPANKLVKEAKKTNGGLKNLKPTKKNKMRLKYFIGNKYYLKYKHKPGYKIVNSLLDSFLEGENSNLEV